MMSPFKASVYFALILLMGYFIFGYAIFFFIKKVILKL